MKLFQLLPKKLHGFACNQPSDADIGWIFGRCGTKALGHGPVQTRIWGNPDRGISGNRYATL